MTDDCDRPQRRPRRGLRPLDAHRRRGPAVRGHQRQRGLRLPRRATRPPCAGCASWPPSAACGSAPRSPTATWPVSGGAPWTCRRDELAAEVAYQIGALEVFARAAGYPGGLRQAARRALQPRVHDAEQAAAVVDGRAAGRRRRCRCSACPARACSTRPRPRDFRAVSEAFADRAYTAAGHAGAARRARRRRHTTPDTVVARARRAGPGPGGRPRTTASGSHVTARSLCLHGDTPGAARAGPARPRARWRRPECAWRRSHEGRQIRTRVAPAHRGPRAMPVGEDWTAHRAGQRGGGPRRCTPSCCAARAAGTLPPVREIVPGRADRAARRARRPARLAADAAPRWRIPPLPREAGDAVEIPVRYDGPDLAEVADAVGRDPDEVARDRTAAPSSGSPSAASPPASAT